MTRYYWLALANLLAAFGGGMVLGKGIGVLKGTLFEEGSVLAFFVGTVVGLVFLQWFPPRWAALSARWFSIGGAVASLGLLALFAAFAVQDKLVGEAAYPFFAVLSLRFALWFYSRVLRAGAAAGQQQRIAWVELGYYVGMSLGLIIWGVFGLALGMVPALIVDAILQLAAGIIDLFTHHAPDPATEQQATDVLEVEADSVGPPLVDRLLEPGGGAEGMEARSGVVVSVAVPEAVLLARPVGYRWYWRMSGAVVLSTVGVQVVTFSVSHQLTEQFAPYVLASFYLGVAIAAALCRATTVRLTWLGAGAGQPGRATIRATVRHVPRAYSFALVAALLATNLGVGIFGIALWGWGTILQSNGAALPENAPLELSMLGPGEILLIGHVGLAALIYEILALALLDRIGEEDGGPQVVRTYGLMGVGSAVSLWALGVAGCSPVAWAMAVGGCILPAVLLVRRRNETIQQE